MIKKYFAMSIIAASVALAACSDDDDDDTTTTTTTPDEMTPDGGVEEPALPPAADTTNDSSAFDVVANSADHTALTAAIIDAGLADVLDDPANTFTIFAPNDAAFAALEAVPTGEDLARVLQYHVVGGETLEIAISEGVTTATDDAPFTLPSILTDADAELTFTTDNGISVMDSFGGLATIETFDLMPQGEGATGVVHSITAVLTPPPATEEPVDPAMTPDGGDGTTTPVAVGGEGTTLLANTGEFTIFLNSLNGPDGTSGSFPGSLDTNLWTFFAPTDAALTAAGITELTAAQLQSHIFTNGALDETALGDLTSITPSDNEARVVTNTDGAITVDGSSVMLLGAGEGGAQIYSIEGVIGADAGTTPQADPETPVDETETTDEDIDAPADDTEVDIDAPADDVEPPAAEPEQ